MSPVKSKSTASSSEIPAPLAAPSSLAGDASPSNPDVLRALYTVLIKTRMLQEQVLSLLRSGRIPGAPVPVLGGEATEVGACIGLQPSDSFSSSQPKLASQVVSGTPLQRVFAELFRREPTPSSTDTAQSMQVVPQTASLTGQLAIAAGIALAHKQLATPNVVVALADDGLAALGFWHEAAILASRHRLPLVFMVENCEQSHSGGTSSVQADEDLRDRAEAYGIPGITVDGNDLVAVWRVTQESIHRARSGAGPTLIECRTWRWHAEVDSPPANGRPTKALREHDPLHHMEHYMKKRNLWKQAWKDRLAEEYQLALKQAVAAAHRPVR